MTNDGFYSATLLTGESDRQREQPDATGDERRKSGIPPVSHLWQ